VISEIAELAIDDFQIGLAIVIGNSQLIRQSPITNMAISDFFEVIEDCD
jgi:hypothetical protein